MKNGDLQVWWIPQIGTPNVPMFETAVPSVEAGALLLETLARYDLFQLEYRIKPDYCNAGGLRRWCDDNDGDGNPGWEDATGVNDPIEFVKTASNKLET